MRHQRMRILTVLLLMLIIIFLTGAYAVASTFGTRTLMMGSVGEDVTFLQQFLNQVNYPVGLVDGIFGSKTRGGVTGFQKDNALVPDGIVGRQTSASMKSRSGGGTNRYPVQAGDTLYWIAIRYGTTVPALQNANGLADDKILLGQSLMLPGVPAATPWSLLPQAERDASLASAIQAKGISTPVADLLIVADKSDHTLSLFSGGARLKSYHIALGDSGPGDKAVSGDHKTPEGRFYVSERSVLDPADQYLGSRWLRLSYPNVEDAERGLKQGLITKETYQEILTAIAAGDIPPQKTALGGGIGIHGGDVPSSGEYWTWGCLGLKNSDVEEIFPYTKIGLSVIIVP